MRIASMTYFTSSLTAMQDNQSSIARLTRQIATGKKILAPKDDPLATQKINELANSIAANKQYTVNQDSAELTLKAEGTALTGFDSLLTQVKSLLSQGSGSDASLNTVKGQQLQALLVQLQDIANSRDTAGNYIFAGYQSATAPFANAGGGAATTYNGDSGVRKVEIAQGRQVQVNDNLDTVVQSGTANDLFQLLGQAAADLQNPALNTSQPASVTTALTALGTAADNLKTIQYRNAGALTEISDARTMVNAILLQQQDALGKLQQVDQASAIVELQSRQTTLQAAEQAYAKTSQLSLFNYLG